MFSEERRGRRRNKNRGNLGILENFWVRKAIPNTLLSSMFRPYLFSQPSKTRFVQKAKTIAS